MQINNLLKKYSNEIINDKLISFIDGLVVLALANNKYRLVEIKAAHNHKYEGDFYGLLYAYGVDPTEHYVNLRMNRLTNSNNYKGELDIIKIIDSNYYIVAMQYYS